MIGAGLAGLSAAIRLTQRGYCVTLSETGPQAGGRCRSYFDPQLGMEIDNGNHLVLSGNRAVHDYLATIGAQDRLTGPGEASFPFMDMRNDRRWTLHPNAGRVPWWVLARSRRVPGTTPRDYLPLRRLIGAHPDRTVGEVLSTQGALWDKLLEPLFVSALNTPAAEGSAALAGAIVDETLGQGGRASAPRIAGPSLAAAFVDPALAWLRGNGAEVRLGRRLRALELAEDRVATLAFADGDKPVSTGEPVVLAVPSWVAAEMMPGLSVPTEHNPIVNAHFRFTSPPGAEPIVGLVGGDAEWVFAFPDRLSTTTSAAARLEGVEREELARRLWAEVAQVHHLSAPLPPWQIVRERRATFAATPEQDRLRPPAATSLANLWLAGDWTQTGLPATIEGAIRSGATAATMAAQHVPA